MVPSGRKDSTIPEKGEASENSAVRGLREETRKSAHEEEESENHETGEDAQILEGGPS